MKNIFFSPSHFCNIIPVALVILFFISCEKAEIPSGNNKIIISATNIEVVTYNWSDLKADFYSFDSNRLNITNHGFCWSTTPVPDLNSSVVVMGPRTESGSINTRLSNLEEKKKYYVRAFANITGGTLYGPISEFSTLERGPAVLLIDSINQIFENSAKCYSTIFSDGGYNIINRGFCWNITGNPTLQNCISFTSEGNGTGTFNSIITGLNASSTYYVKAYATNSEGSAYSNQETFTTVVSCGSVLNITHTAGTIAPVSKTINYGSVLTNLTGSNKCWISQNLGADHQATSATDASEASAGWYWQFNRRQGFKHDGTTRTPNTTWINNLSENSEWLPENDPCALLLGSGWRLPTKTEWQTADASGGWDNYNETFTSALKLHAAGYLVNNDGSLNFRSTQCNYWSSSQGDSDRGRNLHFDNAGSLIYDDEKSNGFNIRCLRD